MNPETRDDFVWLMTDEAAPSLKKVQAAFEERINAVRIAKALRKTTTATRSALVMEQAQLRVRARRKFTRASQMFSRGGDLNRRPGGSWLHTRPGGSKHLQTLQTFVAGSVAT